MTDAAVLKKIENGHVSATVRPIGTKFGFVRDAYWPSKRGRQLKFLTFKNPGWRTAAI